MRAVAAAFMRGRVHQQLGELAPARAAFQAARRYAEAGAPDPMGLARRKPRRGGAARPGRSGFHDTPWPVPANDVDDATFVRLIANAVRLYAEQAARGSKMAVLSLGEVARRLMRR